MIDFSRAFDTAWERMHVILFRPFDFGKWCIIGFSAFLAGLLQGGNGVNGNFNSSNFNNLGKNGGTSTSTQKIDWNQIHTEIAKAFSSTETWMIIAIVAVVMLLVFAIVILIYWLGARGQFMFLDNVVRNRGEIAWPWENYARQANSLFGFYLLMVVVSLAIFLPILIAAVIVCIPLFQQSRWPAGGEITILVVLAIVYVAVAIVFGFLIFVFREFGIPIMFRQGIRARAAFVESMKLIGRHPGSVFVFVLLRFAIFIGTAIISVIICCATCCIGMLPYIGTVLLLPVLVYVKCFTLDCLAQFGPEYDVFSVDVPSTLPGQVPPFIPPQPRG